MEGVKHGGIFPRPAEHFCNNLLPRWVIPIGTIMNRDPARRNSPRIQTSLCCLTSALLIILTMITLCGCKRSDGDPSARSAPPMNVQTVSPKRGEITRSITLPGNVLAWQQATLYAKVPGYLRTIAVDKGDRVKQGALLAEIEVPEIEADLAKNKADLEVADMDYQRLSEARKKSPDLVTPQTVDDA